MPSIASYRKYTDSLISRTLRLPEDPETHRPLGTELATLADGTTYVSLPDGAVLPAEQPPEIAASIVHPVALTLQQVADIKAASPHVRLIDQRVREQIAAQYSTADEIKMLRLAPSAESTAYNAFVESCRGQGHDAKAALGL
jgi:hypothetical protein